MSDAVMRYVATGNWVFAKNVEYPINAVITEIPVIEHIPGDMKLKFTCRRVVVHSENLRRLMFTNNEWFREVMAYLIRKHPKAAKRRRIQKKWVRRAHKAAYGN